MDEFESGRLRGKCDRNVSQKVVCHVSLVSQHCEILRAFLVVHGWDFSAQLRSSPRGLKSASDLFWQMSAAHSLWNFNNLTPLQLG